MILQLQDLQVAGPGSEPLGGGEFWQFWRAAGGAQLVFQPTGGVVSWNLSDSQTWVGSETNHYPLVMTNIAMENQHFSWGNKLEIVMFNSYVCLPEGSSWLGQWNEDPGGPWLKSTSSADLVPWLWLESCWHIVGGRGMPATYWLWTYPSTLWDGSQRACALAMDSSGDHHRSKPKNQWMN